MCEFESNILKLLVEERARLKTIFTDRDAPYMKSLDYGIKTAEKKLEDCEYKKCTQNIYREQIEPLEYWSTLRKEYIRCKRLW